MTTPITRTRSRAEMYDRAHEIRKRGGRLLGEGLFGQVYSDPDHKDRVIKIGTAQGDRYLNYLRAIVTKDNPCFPKIYSVEIGSKSYVVSMEKLYKFNRDRHISVVRKQFGCAFVAELETLEFRPPTEQVKEAKKILQRLFNRYEPDLHSENIMLRKRKELGKIKLDVVITDPIC